MSSRQSDGEIFQAYFQKWMAVKEAIKKDQTKIALIKSIINDNKFDNSPHYLGNGSSNVVYSLGSVKQGTKDIFLAMRIEYSQWYVHPISSFSSSYKSLFSESTVRDDLANLVDTHIKISRGEEYDVDEAIENDTYYPRLVPLSKVPEVKSLPFVGVLKAKNCIGESIEAIITKDVSEGGKYLLDNERAGFSTVLVFEGEGNVQEMKKAKEQYYIDPYTPHDFADVSQYYTLEAILNLDNLK